jgi:hypothetical protein
VRKNEKEKEREREIVRNIQREREGEREGERERADYKNCGQLVYNKIENKIVATDHDKKLLQNYYF